MPIGRIVPHSGGDRLICAGVIQVSCAACGQHYGVTLRQVLLAQQLAHQGCPARHEPECPPVVYSKLADEDALRELDESWWRLVDKVRSAGLEVTF
jgi:hypothetical protein